MGLLEDYKKVGSEAFSKVANFNELLSFAFYWAEKLFRNNSSYEDWQKDKARRRRSLKRPEDILKLHEEDYESSLEEATGCYNLVKKFMDAPTEDNRSAIAKAAVAEVVRATKSPIIINSYTQNYILARIAKAPRYVIHQAIFSVFCAIANGTRYGFQSSLLICGLRDIQDFISYPNNNKLSFLQMMEEWKSAETARTGNQEENQLNWCGQV